MKRIFTTFLALTMSLILAVFASGCSGCSSCNGPTALTFTQNFYGNGEPKVNYKEILTYSVRYDDNYNKFLKNEAVLSEQLISTLKYDGEYTSVFTVRSGLDKDIQTDIPFDPTKPIYHLSTELNIKSTYKINGTYAEGAIDNGDGTFSYDEYIKSEVYFLEKGHSFAPIFSKTEQRYSTISLSSSKASVSLNESSFSIGYNKDSYKITKTKGENTSTENYIYSFKSLIDNNQLLFAIRGLEIAEKSGINIPVVSPTFGAPQSLALSNEAENTITTTLNGYKDVEIPVRNIKFNVSNKFNTGASHFVLVQKGSTNDSIPNKALIIEYASPLVAYGSFVNLGVE